MSMTSSRPYLVRALYNWIIDNQCTPYVLVNALHNQVLVPQDYVNSDGQIVLNISASSANDFVMNQDGVSFNTRFGGVSTAIFLPIAAIMGIYAKENQQGMIFDLEPEGSSPDPTTPSPSRSGSVHKLPCKTRPILKVVK